MPDTLKCPTCEARVLDTGMSSRTMGGPARQYSRCPSCHTKLVRNPESPVPDLRQWRPNEDTEPDTAAAS